VSSLVIASPGRGRGKLREESLLDENPIIGEIPRANLALGMTAFRFGDSVAGFGVKRGQPRVVQAVAADKIDHQKH
jgi:hypothetical protein